MSLASVNSYPKDFTRRSLSPRCLHIPGQRCRRNHQFFRVTGVQFSNLNFSRMVSNINELLSNYENLVFFASTSFGFMSFSLLVFEWQHFEKKCPNKPVLMLADFAQFAVFLNILRKHLTLRGSGGQTT